MEAPTYKEFRDFALTHGYTGRALAPYVEADEPIKTATRILVFLAGTRWDNEPLPYPKLCELYHGNKETASPTHSPRTHVELADALVSGRKDRPWLKSDQYTVTHECTDPYLYITLDPDAPREGIETLAHLSGALRLDANTYRFPYEVLCRAAGSQWRSRGNQQAKEVASLTPIAPRSASRSCPCGSTLTGQASQRFCSPRCRKQASRANPQRIAKNRGVKSVTAIPIATMGVSHPLEAARRADGSIRDRFDDLPSPEFLSRMSADSKVQNELVRAKYPALVHEQPELFG
jgi:hypothetical protein